MIGKPMKKGKGDSLAARARALAVEQGMQAPSRRRAPPPEMSPPPDMGTPAPRGRAMPPPDMAPPPGMAPPGMKKGGKVDFSKIIRNTKTGSLSEKPGMKKGGKVPPKKGGIMIMIAMGKKKGR